MSCNGIGTLEYLAPEQLASDYGLFVVPQSEVGDDTTDIIIESAIFDPVSIRRTAFRYALRSEASQRFEKGQEHRMARLGADRTAALIARWGGGRVATGVVDAICSDHQPHEPDAKSAPFASTQPGMSTLETLLPLVLRLADEQVVPMHTALELVTSRPAGILGIGAMPGQSRAVRAKWPR